MGSVMDAWGLGPHFADHPLNVALALVGIPLAIKGLAVAIALMERLFADDGERAIKRVVADMRRQRESK